MPGICSLNLQLLKIGVNKKKKKAASVFKLTRERKNFFLLNTTFQVLYIYTSFNVSV